jgi:hypothetical protein
MRMAWKWWGGWRVMVSPSSTLLTVAVKGGIRRALGIGILLGGLLLEALCCFVGLVQGGGGLFHVVLGDVEIRGGGL